MVLLQHNETIHPKVKDTLCIRTLYNFIYRLSESTKVAEVLTEKVLMMHAGNFKDDIFLLKQAWSNFVKYYGFLEYKGEKSSRQSLLDIEPEPRCAMILRDILGYPYNQIAFIVDKPESEVAKLIFQGRSRITKGNKVASITLLNG